MAGLLDSLLSGGGGLLGGMLPGQQGQQGQQPGMLGMGPQTMGMLGLGLLSGSNWQDGFRNAIPALATGRALDLAQNEQTQQRQALTQALGRDPAISAEQRAMLQAYPEAGKQYLMSKMAGDKPMEVGGRLVQRQPDGTFKDVYVPPQAPQKPMAVGQNDRLFDPSSGKVLLPAEGGSSKIDADVEARTRQAIAMGMKPGDPAFQSFVLTGKMPREDAQPLTATDKKAILEGDEKVAQGTNAIDNLKKALTLSDKAYSGAAAGTRAWLTNQIGGTESSLATSEMDNLITTNALESLKSIFGGNPTEGERAMLLQIQGSSSMQPEQRKQVIKRAITMAERRLEFERQRAADLRGQTYYKPGGGAGGQTAPQASSGNDGWTDLGDGIRLRAR